MADLTALADVGHFWGSDIQLSPTGDLARASGAERSKQRVFRRLMTNPAASAPNGATSGDYIFHPGYGAGIPAMIGQVLDIARITARIRGQMLLEASVAKSPAPKVTVNQIVGGVSVDLAYVALPDRQPVSLSFDVSA